MKWFAWIYAILFILAMWRELDKMGKLGWSVWEWLGKAAFGILIFGVLFYSLP